MASRPLNKKSFGKKILKNIQFRFRPPETAMKGKLHKKEEREIARSSLQTGIFPRPR